jgi:hypothetical protein
VEKIGSKKTIRPERIFKRSTPNLVPLVCHTFAAALFPAVGAVNSCRELLCENPLPGTLEYRLQPKVWHISRLKPR